MAQSTPGFSDFGAPVPDAEIEKFKRNFPQYGAMKWFINTVLVEFNRQVEENPTAIEQIRETIETITMMTRSAARG